MPTFDFSLPRTSNPLCPPLIVVTWNVQPTKVGESVSARITLFVVDRYSRFHLHIIHTYIQRKFLLSDSVRSAFHKYKQSSLRYPLKVNLSELSVNFLRKSMAFHRKIIDTVESTSIAQD
jgi:hypothetical protein